MSFKTAKNVLSKDEMKKIMAGSDEPSCITVYNYCDPCWYCVPCCSGKNKCVQVYNDIYRCEP